MARGPIPKAGQRAHVRPTVPIVTAPTTGRPLGVLFDVDGTLVDSTYLHAVAWWQAFRYRDLDVPVAGIHRAIGMGADRLVTHVLGEVADDVAGAVTAAHDAIYATWWPALRPLPGATDLVRHCHATGLLTVLASSAGAREVSVVRRVLGIDDQLDVVTSSDDGEHSKPAPDLIEVALRRPISRRATR